MGISDLPVTEITILLTIFGLILAIGRFFYTHYQNVPRMKVVQSAEPYAGTSLLWGGPNSAPEICVLQVRVVNKGKRSIEIHEIGLQTNDDRTLMPDAIKGPQYKKLPSTISDGQSITTTFLVENLESQLLQKNESYLYATHLLAMPAAWQPAMPSFTQQKSRPHAHKGEQP